jgi:thiol-disulfide isomerase/thioredoxin
MSDATSRASDPASDLERAGIVLYGKPGCCLCDDAKPLVTAIGAEYGLPVYQIDILDNQQLYAAYRYRIPVVRYAGVVLDEGRVTEAALRAALRRLPLPVPTATRHAPGR